MAYTQSQLAQWAAATARLAAAGLTGTVGPGALTIAQANQMIAVANATKANAAKTAAALAAAQNRAAIAAQQAALQQQKIANAAAVKAANAAARGQKQIAATQTLETKVQGVLTVKQQNAANLVALRGQNAAQRVSNDITNFNTSLLNKVAGAGASVLTPQFQAQFEQEQAAFATHIGTLGGAYTPVSLIALAPQLQNSILAQQGIGLTNLPTATQENALANLYATGAVAQAIESESGGPTGTGTVITAGATIPPSISGNPTGITSVTPGATTVPGVIDTGAGVVGGTDYVPPVTVPQIAAALTPASSTPIAGATIFGGALGLSDDEWFVVLIGGGAVLFLVLQKKHKA